MNSLSHGTSITGSFKNGILVIGIKSEFIKGKLNKKQTDNFVLLLCYCSNFEAGIEI